MRRRALRLITVLLLTGCGVTSQDSSEKLPALVPPASPTAEDAETDGPRLTVFFVRGRELAPVGRTAMRVSETDALALLAAGPSHREVIAGLRTALPPQLLTVGGHPSEGITTVAVSRDFTGLSGGSQLLAVAQVVWTLTDVPGTQEVTFVVDGVAVEVPTDDGLSSRPVDRDDYRSLAPASASAGPTRPGAGRTTGDGTPPATPTEGAPAT